MHRIRTAVSVRIAGDFLYLFVRLSSLYDLEKTGEVDSHVSRIDMSREEVGFLKLQEINLGSNLSA